MAKVTKIEIRTWNSKTTRQSKSRLTAKLWCLNV